MSAPELSRRQLLQAAVAGTTALTAALAAGPVQIMRLREPVPACPPRWVARLFAPPRSLPGLASWTRMSSRCWPFSAAEYGRAPMSSRKPNDALPN